jgi:DNA-binding MarR family transcriptional regulator
MHQPADIVAQLGYLTLGTRLKRLAEQLQAGVAETLSNHGHEVQPGQLPVLIAISETDGPSVADLVNAMGLTQPGISRTLGTLKQAGLISIRPDKKDARTRRAYLTAKSTALMDRLRSEVFGKVAAAAAELCDGLEILDALAVMERRNREQPFTQRIRKARS